MNYLKNGQKIEETTEYPLGFRIKNNDFINQKILDTIYQKSESFTKGINSFKIYNNTYDITFEEIDNSFAITFKEKNTSYTNSLIILKEPIKIELENEDKTINIYIEDAIVFIEYNLSENYELSKELNNYKIKAKKYSIKEAIKNLYIENKENYDYETIINKKEELISISPLILTPNFYKIFKKNLKTDKFIVFLNDLRKGLIKSISNFLESKRRYYWIIGSDGVGKWKDSLLPGGRREKGTVSSHGEKG